ncbi:MAG TPA: PA14 domain-containing protein, partial [Vicinamibacteria bacterium]
SDAGAQTHSISTPAADTTYTATFASTTVPAGLGLLGTYHDNVDFTGTVVTRLDATVDYDWGTGSPAPGIGADTFSVRWQGQVRAKVTGTHTFFTVSDDGVRLFVNGQLVIDNWTDHAPTENSGTIPLAAGQKYDIRMEMYDNTGQAVARLLWSAPGVAKEVVPQSHLHPYALLVTGSTTLGTGDAAVRDRLESLGHAVVDRTSTAAATADAAGKALVLISSSVSPGAVGEKFRGVVNPVLLWKGSLFDEMGMAGSTVGTDYGTLADQTQIDIVVGGVGSVAVTSAPRVFTWGAPNGNAFVVARAAGDATRATVFAYERGAAMPGLSAPGRRIGFFLSTTTADSLTAAGWAVFDAVLRWASGR